MRFVRKSGEPGTAARKVRMASAIAFLGLVVGIFIAPPATAATEPGAGVGINGVIVTKVLLDGKLISFGDYAKVQAAADAAGAGIAMVIDESAISRGYVVAYRNRADASAYMQSHGMGAMPSSDRDPVVEAATSARHQAEAAAAKASAGTATTMPLSTCGPPNHLGKLYENVACGGAYFSVLWNEADSYLGTYGWNDRASSAAIGDCIGNMTVWINANYSGSSTSYHGGDVYTSLYTFNDAISSLKTNVTAPCA
jgi:hypothetical protein